MKTIQFDTWRHTATARRYCLEIRHYRERRILFRLGLGRRQFVWTMIL